MDRHRLKQLRDKVGELLRFGSPSTMREARSIMRDEFENVLSFALELTKPKSKPKHTIADNYPAGGLTASEPCMFCENYAKLEEQNEKLVIRIEQYKAELDWIDTHLFEDVDTEATRKFIKTKNTSEAKRLLRLCELRDTEKQ